MSDTTNVTQDFIFGTLATDELRLDALAAAGRGVAHGICRIIRSISCVTHRVVGHGSLLWR